MLCRAVLTAIAISYLLCVLLLSGLQKEDIDLNTLTKLERYNVNLHDVNNESLRQECIEKGKLSDVNTGQKFELPITNKSHAVNMSNLRALVLPKALNYFLPKDLNVDYNIPTNVSDINHNINSGNSTTKISGPTILNNNPREISDRYVNTVITQTNYVNKEIRNINFEPNPQKLESTIKFWNNITNRNIAHEVNTIATTTYTDNLIYSIINNNSPHSGEMEYIHKIFKERINSQNYHSPTQNLKQNSIVEPNYKQQIRLGKSDKEIELDLLLKYLISLSQDVKEKTKMVSKQPIDSMLIYPINIKSEILTTTKTPFSNKMDSEYRPFNSISPLINSMEDDFPTNKHLNLPKKDFTSISNANEEDLIKNENLEDWYSNFFRNNMISPSHSTEPTIATDSFQNKGLNTRKQLNNKLIHSDAIGNNYPFTDEQNFRNLFDGSWGRNINELVEKSLDNNINDLVEKPTSFLKDIKLAGLDSILKQESLKLPFINYDRGVNSLTRDNSYGKKIPLNIYNDITYTGNSQKRPLSAYREKERLESKNSKEINKPGLTVTYPNDYQKISWWIRDSIKPENNILDIVVEESNSYKPFDTTTIGTTSNDEPISTTLAVKPDPTVNLNIMSDEEKLSLMTNLLPYINGLLRINQGHKTNVVPVSFNENGTLNIPYFVLRKDNATQTSNSDQIIRNDSEKKDDESVPESLVQRIAASVKAIVLKDIRPVITTPSMPTISKTISTKASTFTTISTSATTPIVLSTTAMTPTTLTTKATSAEGGSSTTVRPHNKYEVNNKSQDADYILRKLIDLIAELKSTTQHTIPASLLSNVLKHEYMLTENDDNNQPTHKPIILNHRLEIISPTFDIYNSKKSGKNAVKKSDNFQSSRQKNTIRVPYSSNHPADEIYRPPITLQTNLYEIAPLGVSIEKPVIPFNQIIVVTTKNPFVKLKNEREFNGKMDKMYTADDVKNQRGKVHNQFIDQVDYSKHSGQWIGVSEENIDRVQGQLSDITDYIKSPRNHDGDSRISKNPSFANKKDRSHIYIDKTKRLRTPERFSHKEFTEPRIINRTTQYKERLHYYNLKGNNQDRGFRSRYMNPTFRRPSPPHDTMKFHERLERVDDWPQPDSKEWKDRLIRLGGEVSSRQQLPLNNLKKRKKFDDTHFRNFLQTQQKVNEMLERILGTKVSTDRQNSVEIL